MLSGDNNNINKKNSNNDLLSAIMASAEGSRHRTTSLCSNASFYSTNSDAPSPTPSDMFPSQKAGSATFVWKLFGMVGDPSVKDFITWSGNGRSFTVYNSEKFSEKVLPKHYKHNNFSSFVRQLNMYGFQKTNRVPRGRKNDGENQTWEFSHPLFIQNRPDLLEDIRRKPETSAAISAEFRRETDALQATITVMCQSEQASRQRVDNLVQTVDHISQTVEGMRQGLTVQREMLKRLYGLQATPFEDWERQIMTELGLVPSQLNSMTAPSTTPGILVTPPEGRSIPVVAQQISMPSGQTLTGHPISRSASPKRRRESVMSRSSAGSEDIYSRSPMLSPMPSVLERSVSPGVNFGALSLGSEDVLLSVSQSTLPVFDQPSNALIENDIFGPSPLVAELEAFLANNK